MLRTCSFPSNAHTNLTDFNTLHCVALHLQWNWPRRVINNNNNQAAIAVAAPTTNIIWTEPELKLKEKSNQIDQKVKKKLFQEKAIFFPFRFVYEWSVKIK